MKILNRLPEIWQREKFGQLILMKIIEIVATRCQILRLGGRGREWEKGQGGKGEKGRVGKEMGGFPGSSDFPC